MIYDIGCERGYGLDVNASASSRTPEDQGRMRNYRLVNRGKIQRSKLANYRSAEEILLGSLDICRAEMLAKAVVGEVVCRGTWCGRGCLGTGM